MLYLKSRMCQLWNWRSQMPFYWRRTFQIPSAKTNSHQIHNWHRQLFKYRSVIPILMKFSQCVQKKVWSSNTELLFLFCWNSHNVYTLVWKHTNKWPNICTFQIPSAKKNSPSNPQLTPTTLQMPSMYLLIQ